MARLTALIALALLAVAALGAGLAAPAGAAVPNLPPHPALEFIRTGVGDVTGVAVSASGARYVCGYETVAGHGLDVSVRRIGSSGWTRYWDGAAHLDDKGWDIAVSSAGSVYVLASSRTKSGGGSTVLLRYSAKGKRLWARRWTGPAGANPSPMRMAIDAQGRIVVVGQYRSGAEPHVFVAKYRSDGRREWLSRYTSGYMTTPNDFCLGGSGVIYVAGTIEPTAASSGDGLLLKYSSTGSLRWRNVYAPLSNAWDTFQAVCRRPAGGVYLAGTSQSSGADSDGIVYRCSAAGKRTLITRLGFGDGAYTELYDIARGADGGIIVCGDWELTDTNYDFYVASFTEAGATKWACSYDSGLGYDRAELLAVSSGGGVTASGFFAAGGGTQDVATYFFSPAGVAEYRNLWPGLIDGQPVARDIAVRGNKVWIAGKTDSMTEGDGFLLRYVP
jgi:hypothetical protein